MEYFNHALESHYMQFLPRYLADGVDVTIHYELKNEQTLIEDLPTIIEGEYMVVMFNYDFVQNGTYMIEVKGENGLIFRTKAKAI
jgi:hypothetical protein